MSEPTIDARRRPMLELLSEILAIERAGARLYRDSAAEAPEEFREHLTEYAEESERHVQLVANAVTELGGDPAYLSGDARLVDAVNDCVLGQTANSKRHWYYRLELLLVYEIRDATIGEVLEQASSAAADPDVADVLERTVLPVASGETAFAHDTPSHRQRLEWLQTTMRTAVLADLGLKPQTRWHRLLHW